VASSLFSGPNPRGCRLSASGSLGPIAHPVHCQRAQHAPVASLRRPESRTLLANVEPRTVQLLDGSESARTSGDDADDANDDDDDQKECRTMR
jgi:hypothetical protein